METLLAIALSGTFIFMLLVLPFIIWVWSMFDVIRSDFRGDGTKLFWFLGIFFLPVLGTIFYILIGRGQRMRY